MTWFTNLWKKEKPDDNFVIKHIIPIYCKYLTKEQIDAIARDMLRLLDEIRLGKIK
jgi:hypothetical protein